MFVRCCTLCSLRDVLVWEFETGRNVHTFSQHDVLVETVCKAPSLVGFDPGVVVEFAFDIAPTVVTMEPDI